MTCKDVDLSFGAHIPHSRRGITARRDKDVKCWMQGQGIDAREMAMVMSDNFIRFQIPALHHLNGTIRSGWMKQWKMNTLSSPQENRYGWRGDTAKPRTVEMCPVNHNFSSPDAKSHILITRSPAPVANHL